MSEAVKTQVSLHLNTWGQQLAHYIDTRYLRLEQYERLELCKEERLRASHQTVKQDVLEVGKYMTREQKALAVRNKRREIGANYLPYFTLRSRVGLSGTISLFAQIRCHILYWRAGYKRCCVEGKMSFAKEHR